MKRSAERTEFLQDVLVTAIENYGYGWFTVERWTDDDHNSADIADEETEIKYHVDLDTLARGIQVIKDARPAQFQVSGYSTPDMIDMALANARTGERLYLSEDGRSTIMEASRDNDAGEIDVVLALAILECGIFGQVTYA